MVCRKWNSTWWQWRLDTHWVYAMYMVKNSSRSNWSKWTPNTLHERISHSIYLL